MLTEGKTIYFVCLIGGLFRLIEQSCAASSETYNWTVESRKLSDSIETITSVNNLIGEPNSLLLNEQITGNDFKYFNEPITPKYEVPSYSNSVTPLVNNSQPYYTPLLTTPYVSNSYLSTEVHPQHYLRIAKRPEPQWTKEIIKIPYLENQYMEGFRNIKSSVMNFFYKVQDFMSYMMSFFTFDNPSLVEARAKKFKIKKKYKKFLLPLLIAYKLKFFALIPIIIGGLILLVGSTGMAGFFFALFTAVISLKDRH